MKSVATIFLSFLLFTSVYSQSALETYDSKTTLSADQCFDVMKTVWDGVKKLSDEHNAQVSEKSEFESTSEYQARVRLGRNEYIGKIRKYASKKEIAGKVFSVWMKADLDKYNADKQVYSVSSPTKILIQPKKGDIETTTSNNKFVSIIEDDERGYRRAYIELRTDPDFSWFVNRVTAQSAKDKEKEIYFKLSFTIQIQYNARTHMVEIRIVPQKLALMDKPDNFVYWSENIP